MTQAAFAFGLGLGTQNNKGEWLDSFYPSPLLTPSSALISAVQTVIAPLSGNTSIAISNEQMAQLAEALAATDSTQAAIAAQLASGNQPLLLTMLSSDDAPSSVPEGYLKLHLLSHRLVKPHNINLTGLFGVLPNVAWTSEGAVDIAELQDRQLQARLKGAMLEVMSVDKFPKMTNYVVPTGVRIAHTARVRLGAYLGEGTTIMHEGFVNFNAGTEGPGMIEGRISAGVMVGSGSDLGGGCSTMGTLSGGNNIIISVGKECLIGANAGVGIPLGDRCTIEAGLYITAGSIITMIDANGTIAGTTKARELSGQSDLLFRRNSKNGAIEVLTNKSAIALNEMLHAHN
ncbi:2,3,4,5-tetrahydropyridine-2,6-dicarboxylate N-succinyltransferase [Zhongshania aliphaticivorans]|uniref:2,3,4,5-tetrahydropyridine-2,6-dicarboxylate N-succinyltransferase n=1 Tax=Zhongshania aliphaticivorans TaxID=1470434 RepID=A0A5S9MPU2_9GAMM|nr:2,3,4,5-tetrahydropyridine-2,6-dicarboxylate N-succinyltransferase [Zhongshania aliphaticivorans]CAA0078697.1 2,3,4,5-tetrahydropyridine-2,6-dicarboxylate N-succinyltransferase [Zhongshania aliphaticivorans]CAA0086481.1 2,3,4,5-tetrahydropyridine-2,6-dicarboxylate N-succinyltransferase [Zhongshania aliphaticivorans]